MNNNILDFDKYNCTDNNLSIIKSHSFIRSLIKNNYFPAAKYFECIHCKVVLCLFEDFDLYFSRLKNRNKNININVSCTEICVQNILT